MPASQPPARPASTSTSLLNSLSPPQNHLQVRGKVANIKLQLRELVFNEFSRFGREGSDDAAAFRRGELADACLVVEALEPHVKEELVGSLCNREITSYMQIFSATQGEASHLDKVERRYAYIKQKIKQREDSWSIFPVSWRVPQLITLALCKARQPLRSHSRGSYVHRCPSSCCDGDTHSGSHTPWKPLVMP